jgi:hypothetical protein
MTENRLRRMVPPNSQLWTPRRVISQGSPGGTSAMDIERLSRFGSAVRDRATAAWAMTMAYLAAGRWLVHSKQLIIGCVLLYLVLLCAPWGWSAYASKPELFTPFFTPIAALLVGLVAFGQLQVASLNYARPLL